MQPNRFWIVPVRRPSDPYSQLRAAISSNLLQELRKIVESEAASGLGCLRFEFIVSELNQIGPSTKHLYAVSRDMWLFVYWCFCLILRRLISGILPIGAGRFDFATQRKREETRFLAMVQGLGTLAQGMCKNIICALSCWWKFNMDFGSWHVRFVVLVLLRQGLQHTGRYGGWTFCDALTY